MKNIMIEVACRKCGKIRQMQLRDYERRTLTGLCLDCYRGNDRLLSVQRLLENTREVGACLVWQGAKNTRGYSFISIGAKLIRVHRLIWKLAYGDIPQGLNVLHKCDNPPCIKLDHLFLGTLKDNTRDAILKGRFRPSEFGKLAHSLVTAERL